MPRSRPRHSLRIAPSLLLLLTACQPTLADFPVPVPEPPTQVLVCPNTSARVESELIGPEGGTVELNGHSLYIPAGALQEAQTITLIEPVAPYLLVAVEPSTMQLSPRARLTISTQRCGPSVPVPPELSILRWEPPAGWLKPGGAETRSAREGSFFLFSVELDHLSVYTVGAV